MQNLTGKNEFRHPRQVHLTALQAPPSNLGTHFDRTNPFDTRDFSTARSKLGIASDNLGNKTAIVLNAPTFDCQLSCLF
jgi:hypothetical protein